MKYLCQSASLSPYQRYTSPRTLVVGRTARAAEAHAAQVGLMPVAVAPARHRHGPVAICTGHCAVGGVVSQVARGPAGDLLRVGGEGGGRGVQLVREGTVVVVALSMLWWGQVVVLVVGFGDICM